MMSNSHPQSHLSAPRFVAAVRADYLNTLAGQQTELAEQAVLENTPQNLLNNANNAPSAEEITQQQAEAVASGQNLSVPSFGFSLQDLLNNNQESDPEGSPVIPSFGFNFNSLLNTEGND